MFKNKTSKDDIMKLLDIESISIEKYENGLEDKSYIITKDFRGDLTSIKPYNITLNTEKLMDSVSQAMNMGKSIVDKNTLGIVSSFLLILKNVVGCSKIKIKDDEAKVFVGLWMNVNYKHEISVSDGFEAVNKILTNKQKNKLSKSKYNRILDTLANIKAIEINDSVN